VSEDAYRITMAVAGFAQDEIELTPVEGRKVEGPHDHILLGAT
jgi:HSP20 family molecular chaperone IbpA